MKNTKTTRHFGFTLLEVMVSIAIIAIALMAVLGSQSQGSSLANESKFNTTAAFLAQSRMAELEVLSLNDLGSGSGDFGDDFPEYRWEVSVQGLALEGLSMVSEKIKQIDVTVFLSAVPQNRYRLRLYRFFPAAT